MKTKYLIFLDLSKGSIHKITETIKKYSKNNNIIGNKGYINVIYCDLIAPKQPNDIYCELIHTI